MVRQGLSATVVAVVAVVGIVLLECFALHEGVDGVALSAAIGGIMVIAGGFIGFKVRDIWKG